MVRSANCRGVTAATRTLSPSAVAKSRANPPSGWMSARRLMARRCSAVVPPHTPSVTPCSSAQARHRTSIGQAWQILMASQT